jgi:cytochrome oxidase assembly protein ShyY1
VSVPQGEVEVRGLWRALPQPALRLSVDNCPVDAHFPHLVEYPTAEDLSCLVGSPVAPGELLLDPAAADGYVREWSEITPGMPPERHYAYAAQWFAFCATLLVLFVTLNLRRLP